MEYLYGNTEIKRRLAVPQWFIPHINGYPMSKLGEFCYEHDIIIECRYDSIPNTSVLYFRGRNMFGNFGVAHTIEYKMVNKDNISSLEDTLIKSIKEKFDIREDECFMVTPRTSEEYYKEIMNARYGVRNAKTEIKKVIFSGPCTIVMWSDGDKTIVRCGKKDTFDKEKGLAMAISKKMLGTNSSKSSYYDVFKEYIQEEK